MTSDEPVNVRMKNNTVSADKLEIADKKQLGGDLFRQCEINDRAGPRSASRSSERANNEARSNWIPGLEFGLALLIANAALAQRAGPVCRAAIPVAGECRCRRSSNDFDKANRRRSIRAASSRSRSEATMRASTLTAPSSSAIRLAAKAAMRTAVVAVQVPERPATGGQAHRSHRPRHCGREGNGSAPAIAAFTSAPSNKVYLIGNPTLSECGNVVKGDKDSASSTI